MTRLAAFIARLLHAIQLNNLHSSGAGLSDTAGRNWKAKR